MIPRRSLITFGFLLIVASSAHARIGYGVPGLDDPTTLWPGVWEVAFGLEGGSGYRRDKAKIDAIRVPVTITYGWQERLEVGVAVPFAFQNSNDPRFDGSGLGDVSTNLKYQMTREEGNTPSSSTELRLGYGPGDVVASDDFSVGIFYAVAKSFGARSAAHLNLGYTIFRGNRDDVFSWGVAYEMSLRDRLRWTAGVTAGNRIVTGVRKDVVAELGLAGEINSSLEYFVSGGAGLTKESPTWLLRLGLKKEFGQLAGEATPHRRGEWNLPPAPVVSEIVNKGEVAARTGDYALAVSYYREAIAKDSSIPSAWNNMGIALFKLGRTGEALEAYEIAAKLDVSNADIYFNMGLAHYKLGDLVAARKAFARALELNPQHSIARSNLLSLEGRSGAGSGAGGI